MKSLKVGAIIFLEQPKLGSFECASISVSEAFPENGLPLQRISLTYSTLMSTKTVIPQRSGASSASVSSMVTV
jgi:hypothetical protein